MIKLYSFTEIKSIISNVINERAIKNVYRFVDFKLQHYTITNKYVIDLQKLLKINKQKYHNKQKNDSKMSTKSGENKILIDLYPQENQKKQKVIKKKKKTTSQKVQLQILTQNIQEMIRNIQDNRKLQIFKMQMESKRIFNTYKLKNMFQKSRQQQFKRNIDKDILKLQKNVISHKKSHKLPTERLQTNPDPQFEEYGLSIIRSSKYYANHNKRMKSKSKSRQNLQQHNFINQRQNSKSYKKLSSHRLNTQRSQISKDKHSRMHTEYDSTVILKTKKSKEKIRDVYSPCFNKIQSKSKSKSNFSYSKSKEKMSLKFKVQKK